MMDNYCVFILTHGRPDRVYTLETLKKQGYTGDWYLVVDDEDDTIDQYIDNYGEDKVLIFSKQDMIDKGDMDRGDNFDRRKVILYARNICFDLAEELGYKYFWEFDDDYTGFYWRFDDQYNYTAHTPSIGSKLDEMFDSMLKFYKKSGATTIAFSQGGDFIGGKDGAMGSKPRLKRKAMNTFLCSTDRQFRFMGSINEDVNAYTRLQQLGELMLTVNLISVDQKTTQSNKDGMTDVYLEQGTYIKSFYSILYCPASVRLRLMGNTNMRIHHSVKWKHTVPKIISERYKK